MNPTSCPNCRDSGWIIVQRNGVEAADRCPCFEMRRPAGPAPSTEECAHAAERILKTTPFAPKNDEDMDRELTTWIAARIGTARELRMFRIYLAENLAEWRGIAGLVPLLAAMREHVGHQRATQEYDRKLIAWKDELRQLGAAPGPLVIEGQLIKRIEAPRSEVA